MILLWYHFDVKLITRDTDYAARALVFMAGRKNEIVPVSELVHRLNIPRPFLRKILQILNRERLLKSYKGQRGGFRLNTAAKNIFLLDLMRIFQGPVKLNECLFKKKICPDRSACLLRGAINNIEESVVSQLRHITIEGLVKK